MLAHRSSWRFTPLFAFMALSFQLLFFVFSPNANAFSLFGSSNNAPKFVRVEQAFPFNFQQNDHELHLNWDIRDGYYLYQHRIEIKANNARLGDIVMPPATPHEDGYFGKVQIYPQPLNITVPIIQADANATLSVTYQGCAAAGLCYPPETKVIPLDPVSGLDIAPNNLMGKLDSNIVNKSVSATIANAAPATEQTQLASDLHQRWWTPLIFLVLGFGLAFTPCVLPMYPILTGIVLGGGKLKWPQAFKLSFVYVQGMALTYTLLGLVVASAGMQFQAALQSPSILIGLSVLFILLACSMFGAFTLQLPSSLQTKLANLSNQQKGGHLGGVFLMGVISGLVCSPCTTAPLSGALIYVAQSGNLFTGGLALYALAIGMGIPLILAALFGNQLLPKAGNWMNYIKVFFGFVLLAVPIFLLERILPTALVPYLWGSLGIVAFGWLYHAASTSKASVLRSIIAVIAILGLILASQPWLSLMGFNTTQTSIRSVIPKVQFQQIHNTEQLNAALTQAKAEGKPVMLDYYADWCVACKEFDEKTFHDPAVATKLQNFVLLQFDATKTDPTITAFLTKHNVLGLPTIDFWNDKGVAIPSARLTGFMPPKPFLDHIIENHLIQQ